MKKSWKDRIRYKFDNLMSRGTIALVEMLFIITLVVVIITGVLSALTNNGMGFGNNIWMSLQHAIDAGNLAGDDTGNVAHVLLMSLVTICGIFITSILIGIITTGFEDKLTELKKGHSIVVENGHTVILGFDEHIYSLLSELILANENHPNSCIVVIGNCDKEEMEQKIKQQISDTKTTRIICRTGEITELHTMKIASVETCRSIIINEKNDFLIIKAILATINYMKSENVFENEAHITASISDKLNYEAALIAGEGKVELIYTQEIISRIIAHTCRQPGLSNVLIELFDYDGDELYFEKYEELTGYTFGQALHGFEKAVLFGIKRNGKILLNPSKEMILEKDDLYLILEDDDGGAKTNLTQLKDWENTPINAMRSKLSSEKQLEEPPVLLVLGSNRELPGILKELDCYVAEGSRVILAVEEDAEAVWEQYSYHNLNITISRCNLSDRRDLNRLLQEEIEHVLILSDLECDADMADAKTLLELIHLRDISNKEQKHFNITSEMQLVENQRLAKVAQVNDFVVGTNIINLILTQISENRDLTGVFMNLLDEEDSEIYMKEVSRYAEPGQKVDFHLITQNAAGYGEIAVGYKKIKENGEFEIITNPLKSTPLVFEEKDKIIVLAED